MDKTLLIYVTQEDINRGRQANTFSCPIARAVKRTLNAAEVSVNSSGIYWTDTKDFYCEANLPAVAVSFIEKFDYDGGVEPFSFNLDVVDWKPGQTAEQREYTSFLRRKAEVLADLYSAQVV